MLLSFVRACLESRVIRFLMSGGIATAVNLATLYTLTEFFGVWYIFSSVVALTFGFLTSFILQKFWTFENRRLDRVHIQLPLHVALSLSNIVINAILLYVFVEYIDLWYILAQLISTAMLACMNYFVYHFIIFPKEPSHEVH